MKHVTKLLNLGFLLALLAFALLGLGKALLRPKAINDYENRPAYQLTAPTLGSILDTSFQANVENALSDQVLLSQTMKRQYNLGSSRLAQRLTAWYLQSRPQCYVNLQGAKIFAGDRIVTSPLTLNETLEGQLQEKANNLNAQFAAHPQLPFYVYYIERDADLNFETGEKSGIYEAFSQKLALGSDHMARFQVNSFEDFAGNFYHTDHHWNNRGSYQGYLEVLSLLGISDPPLVPQEEVTLQENFSGSRAGSSGLTGVFTEPFPAYRFSFPPMEITINGEPAPDYGRQEAYLNGSGPQSISYASFYGGDNGEIILDTGREGKENLLVIGESYDNAILKLLASHFGKTYSVDLRNYEGATGHPFAFSDYVEEHRIDRVLLIGSSSYFTMSEFLLED